MSQAVKVMVRCRPMNQKEKDRGCLNVVTIDTNLKQVSLFKQETKQQPKNFTFDYVFGAQSPQNLIYEQSAFSLVDNVLQGYNGTIFAYGQTGCGKTHTMMGSNQKQQHKGIIPRTFSQIMTITNNDSKNHLVRCSFIQIYNQQIHDLLSKDIKAKMDLKESPQKGIFVKDLSQIEVDCIDKMQHYMEIGFKNRATRATNMNNESSRSHSIFTIYIDSQETDQLGNEKYKASKLNLVDLAGSQRASKTGATGDGMKQATKINLSLSALGNVISALVDGKSQHIPYRDSKLTRLLQDSLGGNTKTIMIAAVSPANYNYDETLSTLRYASRAKFIQNKPKVNQDPKDALLRQYMQQIKKLKLMLEGKLPETVTMGNNSITIQQKIIYRDGQTKQNTKLEQQLKNKQNMLKQQQQQKIKLKQKLQQLQKHLSKGPIAQNNQTEIQKIKKLKEKLKIQKKKQEEYQQEKSKRQSQLLNIQKNYKNLNEQVEEMRTRFQQIKNKYVANLAQLRDIQIQHQQQRQQILDTVRYQQKQVKKYQAILNIIMSSDQLQLIVNNSQWNQQKRQWYIPPFTYREKTVNFPKLNYNSKDLIQAEKEKKEIQFKQPKKQLLNDKKQEGQFRVHHIVKGAREVNQQQNGRGTSLASKTQLVSLKSESYERAKIVLPATNEIKKKLDRLDPIRNIQGTQSRKLLNLQ